MTHFNNQLVFFVTGFAFLDDSILLRHIIYDNVTRCRYCRDRLANIHKLPKTLSEIIYRHNVREVEDRCKNVGL